MYECSVCGRRGTSLIDIKKHQAEQHADEVVQVSKEVCKHWKRGNWGILVAMVMDPFS